MAWDNNIAQYIYDDVGSPVGMILNGDFYFFEKNLLGDIVGVYTEAGVQVLAFTYDAWGKILSTSGSVIETVVETAAIFRYRGYQYDSELSFTSITHRTSLTSLTRKNEKRLKNNKNEAILHII